MKDFIEDDQQPQQPQASRKSRESGSEFWIGCLHDLAYILAALMVLCLLFFRVVVVSGPSMYHTLVDGDYLLLVSNTFYKNPQQGDIVVAGGTGYEGGQPIVKRIIATEGQEVNIDFNQGIVYVDGVPLEEDYTYTSTTLWEGTQFPLTVEPGHVFLMGDNRNNSMDSRDPRIGQVDKRQILGKAVLLFLPGNNKGQEKMDFSRIGVID